VAGLDAAGDGGGVLTWQPNSLLAGDAAAAPGAWLKPRTSCQGDQGPVVEAAATDAAVAMSGAHKTSDVYCSGGRDAAAVAMTSPTAEQ
jgi:hypothetical protein